MTHRIALLVFVDALGDAVPFVPAVRYVLRWLHRCGGARAFTVAPTRAGFGAGVGSHGYENRQVSTMSRACQYAGHGELGFGGKRRTQYAFAATNSIAYNRLRSAHHRRLWDCFQS